MASTQVTHQLATPLATMQILFDELNELQPNNPVVADMAAPLQQCCEQLTAFRDFATGIREKKSQQYHLKIVVKQLQELFQLQFPLQALNMPELTLPDVTFSGNGLLLPALFNILQNAVQANEGNQQQKVDMSVELLNSDTQPAYVKLMFRDYGQGLSDEHKWALGEQLQPSQHGFGMALLLSNTTIERFKGRLLLSNHPEQGAIAQVELPVYCSNETLISMAGKNA